MMMINNLDAHDRPPESIKGVYKIYQKLTPEAIQSDPTIIDFRRGLTGEQQCKVRSIGSVPLSSIDAACSHLRLAGAHKDAAHAALSLDVPMYETIAVPGKP